MAATRQRLALLIGASVTTAHGGGRFAMAFHHCMTSGVGERFGLRPPWMAGWTTSHGLEGRKPDKWEDPIKTLIPMHQLRQR